MNAPLYTIEILRLAASLPAPATLDRVDGASTQRSPTCGSTLSVEIRRDATGRVEALSQQVQACAFGQASAALVAGHAVGRDRADVRQALAQLETWLAGTSDDLPDWPGIAALGPARKRKSRHGAILLPFRALAAAMEPVE